MDFKGKICIIRDNMAGVFFGTVEEYDLAAKTATVTNARKIHTWYGALAVEDIAASGVDVNKSKITATVDAIGLCNVVQIAVCSVAGAVMLTNARAWRP